MLLLKKEVGFHLPERRKLYEPGCILADFADNISCYRNCNYGAYHHLVCVRRFCRHHCGGFKYTAVCADYAVPDRIGGTAAVYPADCHEIF